MSPVPTPVAVTPEEHAAVERRYQKVIDVCKQLIRERDDRLALPPTILAWLVGRPDVVRLLSELHTRSYTPTDVEQLRRIVAGTGIDGARRVEDAGSWTSSRTSPTRRSP